MILNDYLSIHWRVSGGCCVYLWWEKLSECHKDLLGKNSFVCLFIIIVIMSQGLVEHWLCSILSPQTTLVRLIVVSCVEFSSRSLFSDFTVVDIRRWRFMATRDGRQKTATFWWCKGNDLSWSKWQDDAFAVGFSDSETQSRPRLFIVLHYKTDTFKP